MARRIEPAGVRYRYRGKFLTPGQAARYANLRNVQKYITTQFVSREGKGPVRKGYTAPIEKQIERALVKSRLEAKERIRQRAITGAEARARVREKMKHARETGELKQTVERVTRVAEREDIDIEDALDRVGYDPDVLADFGPDDIIDYAETYMDEGEEFFDFELMDLEEDESEEESP